VASGPRPHTKPQCCDLCATEEASAFKTRWQHVCEPCKAARGAKYRETNRERLLAKSREYGAKRRVEQADKVKSEKRAYAKKHKDHIRAYMTRYVDEHRNEIRAIARLASRKRSQKPEVKEYAKAWRRANPDKQRQYARKWISGNRWLTCLYAQNRRVRQKMALNTLTPSEWQAILGYFGHACAYCLRTDVKLTIEHVIPIIEGGPHSEENVVPACSSCNSKKGPRSILTMLKRAA
jgi:5-methylcytosine-specific restriction endonuclease McrA